MSAVTCRVTAAQSNTERVAPAMEVPDDRRRRLKNAWQKSVRDKTKDLLGQLESMLPDQGSARNRRTGPKPKSGAGDGMQNRAVPR